MRFHRLAARASVLLAVAIVALVALPATPAAAASAGGADRLIAVTRQHIGDRYVFGAAGPRTFDCSGLVLYSLQKSGNGKVIRSGLRTARAIYQDFKKRGKASRAGGRPGDLVVWGGGQHIGVYLGNGKAISALSSRGVTTHKVSAFSAPFTAFLQTGLANKRS